LRQGFCGGNKGASGWCAGGQWQRWEPVDRQLGPRGLQKGRALSWRDLQALGQPFGDLARGAALVRLDLTDGDDGAADLLGERLAGQVERAPPPPNPVAE
jgi:hypothetical protein